MHERNKPKPDFRCKFVSLDTKRLATKADLARMTRVLNAQMAEIVSLLTKPIREPSHAVVRFNAPEPE